MLVLEIGMQALLFFFLKICNIIEIIPFLSLKYKFNYE